MSDLNLYKSVTVSLAKAGYKSESEFCRLTGVSRSTVARIKQDNTAAISTLKVICEHLKISVSEFLDNGK